MAFKKYSTTNLELIDQESPDWVEENNKAASKKAEAKEQEVKQGKEDK